MAGLLVGTTAGSGTQRREHRNTPAGWSQSRAAVALAEPRNLRLGPQSDVHLFVEGTNGQTAPSDVHMNPAWSCLCCVQREMPMVSFTKIKNTFVFNYIEPFVNALLDHRLPILCRRALVNEGPRIGLDIIRR